MHHHPTWRFGGVAISRVIGTLSKAISTATLTIEPYNHPSEPPSSPSYRSGLDEVEKPGKALRIEVLLGQHLQALEITTTHGGLTKIREPQT